MQESVSTPGAAPLGFALHVQGGRGMLVLRDFSTSLGASSSRGWLRVDRLELEIPNVSFPLDVAGGAVRFQKKRCRVASGTFSVDDAALEALVVARAPRLLEAGFD